MSLITFHTLGHVYVCVCIVQLKQSTRQRQDLIGSDLGGVSHPMNFELDFGDHFAWSQPKIEHLQSYVAMIHVLHDSFCLC